MDTTKGRKGRHYLAAMVIGTALAAGGTSEAAGVREIPGQAISDISRYCTTCWRNARLPVDRWGDCTQEVLQRLLERLEPDAWAQVMARDGEERREFVRAIDAVKKRTQRERRAFSLIDDTATGRGPYGDLQDERDAVREAASQLLSQRQQRILQMTCEGWSVAAMADELGTSADRVSDEKYKAVQKLRAYFKAHPDGRG